MMMTQQRPNHRGESMITPSPEFSNAELRAMHQWCLKYSALVRSGGTPSPYHARQFLAYSKVTYAYGVAYECA
ncbi:MAG: hypothetical protein Hals2KO_02520 [Halioglobus sp.]